MVQGSQVPQPTCFWKWVGCTIPLKHSWQLGNLTTEKCGQLYETQRGEIPLLFSFPICQSYNSSHLDHTAGNLETWVEANLQRSCFANKRRLSRQTIGRSKGTTCMNRPNREELSFLMVFALPNASRIVLASRICCCTHVEMFAVTLGS